MKIITSKNKIILSIFLFACFSSADDVDIKYYLNSNEFFNRDIDIDNDGVADKVISNVNGFGDELLFFKKIIIITISSLKGVIFLRMEARELMI